MKGKLLWATIVTFLVLGVLLTGVFWAIMWFLRISGPSLIIFTFGFVGIMLLVQWAIGPAIIKRLTKMRECTDEGIIRVVHELADDAKIPRPKVYTVENPTPNAFAFGRTQGSAGVALHTGLLQRLEPDELRAVIAHEIGHIKHRDVLVMTLASALPVILYYIVFFGMIAASSRDNRGGGFNYLGAFIGGMVAQFIGTLLVLYLSRVREYYADAHSAYATRKPASLANALAKISYAHATAKRRPTPGNLRMFYIADPQMAMAGDYAADMKREKKRGGILEFLMTHPPTWKRVRALERIEKQL
jgi:heat shock protein HtpX